MLPGKPWGCCPLSFMCGACIWELLQCRLSCKVLKLELQRGLCTMAPLQRMPQQLFVQQPPALGMLEQQRWASANTMR